MAVSREQEVGPAGTALLQQCPRMSRGECRKRTPLLSTAGRVWGGGLDRQWVFIGRKQPRSSWGDGAGSSFWTGPQPRMQVHSVGSLAPHCLASLLVLDSGGSVTI